mmetsp:Transcript_26882/g.57159  ORF Transcript_26882/g.57159 Transcript_26882/m.57159 type:complete len:107 (-) Transcript_26882:57-377(-)
MMGGQQYRTLPPSMMVETIVFVTYACSGKMCTLYEGIALLSLAWYTKQSSWRLKVEKAVSNMQQAQIAPSQSCLLGWRPQFGRGCRQASIKSAQEQKWANEISLAL